MYKKLLSLIFASLLLTSQLTVLASEAVIEDKNNKSEENIVIPKRIENEIYNCIVQVYGEKQAKTIYDRVMQIAKESIEKRPEALKKEDLSRADDWYKDEIIYMFYVDQFGVVSPEKPNTFRDTSAMFEYLKDLGVTTLYLLPFADSPMSDSGFDVKNPQNIRADLGGKTQFKEFVVEAKKNGFKIKSDLVLNHISDEHEWFQDFLKGDVSKKDYFVVKDKMPKYKKYIDEKVGTIVEYQEENGKISKRRLIFPQITGLHGLLHTVFGLELRNHIFSIQVIQLLSCPPTHAGKQIAAQKVQHVMPGNKHTRDQRTLCTFVLLPVHRMVQILSIKLDRHADTKLRRSSPGKTNLVISRHQTYFTSYPFAGFLSE